ncbi:MAG: YdeI/OmpD-associated family protein [Gallionella sp.]
MNATLCPTSSVMRWTRKNSLRAYDARPPYQRNDYIGRITRAKLPATQQKRLDQMLDELVRGDVYMKMVWRKKS